MILEGKKIEFQKIDIAASSEAKNKMREISNDSKALPPQICNGDQYCGVRKLYICSIHKYILYSLLIFLLDNLYTVTYINAVKCLLLAIDVSFIL